MPERFLDHDASVFGQVGVRQAPDGHLEERGGDLQVEHRMPRLAEGLGEPLVGGGVGEVSSDVTHPGYQALERVRVDPPRVVTDRRRHRVARVLSQVIVGPVVDGHPDDGALEPAGAFESVERDERHLPRQVAADPERDERVGADLVPGFVLSCSHDPNLPTRAEP